MQNQLKIFENEEFGKVRTLVKNDEPYFMGKDIAEILGYSNTNKAILDHVDIDDKIDGVTIRDAIGREQKTTFINESGLYSLILSSKLESAKRFKRWVTSEVLPSIRQNGGYIENQKQLSSEEIMAQAVLVAQSVINQKDKQLEVQAPKVLFADSVASSKTSILVGDMAKILKQNGYEFGQNRFFEWLRENGYLISKQGSNYNMPTQRSMELGLFEIKETSIMHADGHTSIGKTSKITGKGQVYFINKLKESVGV